MICLHHSTRSSCLATPMAAMFSEASLISAWNQFRFWMVGVQILQQVRLECYHKGKVSGIPIGNFYSMFWPAMCSNKGFRAVKGVRAAEQHKSRGFQSQASELGRQGSGTCCKQLTLSIWAFVWTPRRLSTTECATLSDFPLFVGA